MFTRLRPDPVERPEGPGVFGPLAAIQPGALPGAVVDLDFDIADRGASGCAVNAVAFPLAKNLSENSVVAQRLDVSSPTREQRMFVVACQHTRVGVPKA